jgi:type VI secretion system protein ImpJ
MKFKKAVHWYEGQFLAPQHFQLSDLYFQTLLNPLREVLAANFWGVGSLSISRAAILNQRVNIESCRLIFQDGAYIEVPGNGRIESRSFEGAWADPEKPFMVYLGLRLFQRDAVNALSPDRTDAQNVRFLAEDTATEYRDFYGDAQNAPVRQLTYQVRLFWEQEVENLGDWNVFPIARLLRQGESFKLDESFIAPAYRIDALEAIMRIVRDLRDDLAGRVLQLAEYKLSMDTQRVESDALHREFLYALLTLNRAVPALFHFVELGHAHPEAVYLFMRQLVGELSTFSDRCGTLGDYEGQAPLLPYDHRNIAACFTMAQQITTRLLNEISVGPEFLVKLEAVDGFLQGTCPERFFVNRNRFFLVLRADTDAVDMLEQFNSSAKLAALEEMPLLISRALPGLELDRLAVAPQGMPRRPNSHYFRIEQLSDEWEKVVRSGQIALFWPGMPESVKAEIIVLRK